MRDIYLFTSKPMDFAECKKVINEKIKYVDDNLVRSFWSTSKNHWYLDLDNDGMFDDITDEGHLEDIKEWAERIPIGKPFLNRLGIHRSIDAKRLVAALVTIYPDLYVNVDDTEQFFGTAQEYIDTEFDY